MAELEGELRPDEALLRESGCTHGRGRKEGVCNQSLRQMCGLGGASLMYNGFTFLVQFMRNN